MDTVIMSYDTIFCMMYVDAMLLCSGQMCGTAVFGFGVFLMLNTKVSALIPTLSSLNLANTLFITGIIITCVSFLGFLGALKENRCLLITVGLTWNSYFTLFCIQQRHRSLHSLSLL